MEYESLEIAGSDKVYEPSDDSYLAASFIERHMDESKRKNLKVLDLGTGSGILGITASLSSKVSSLTFADINRDAVNLSKMNFMKNKRHPNQQNAFIRSNLFSNIKEKFDLIIFNAPYLPSEDEKGDLSKAWSGGSKGIEISARFLKDANEHLENMGEIIIVESSLAALEEFRRIITKLGFEIVKSEKKHVFFEDIVLFLLRRVT